MVRQGIKATHKCFRVEGGFSGPARFKDRAKTKQCWLLQTSQQGGTHSAEMCAVLWKMMTWCHHYQITLRARHILGCQNVMANLPGRTKSNQQNGHCIHRPSTSLSGPYLKMVQRKFGGFLHSICETSLRIFIHLYQDLNRHPSTIDGYRMTIVDTLILTRFHISQSFDLNKTAFLLALASGKRHSKIHGTVPAFTNMVDRHFKKTGPCVQYGP